MAIAGKDFVRAWGVGADLARTTAREISGERSVTGKSGRGANVSSAADLRWSRRGPSLQAFGDDLARSDGPERIMASCWGIAYGRAGNGDG